MDGTVLFTKLLILIAFIMRYAYGKLSLSYMGMFILLLMVAMNVFMVFLDKKYKTFILFLLIAITIYLSIYIDILFLIFIPINTYELLSKYTDELIYYLLPLVLTYIIKDTNLKTEYFIVTTLSFVICYRELYNKERIAFFANENELLKENNYKLCEKIDKMNIYDEQLAYTSQLEERNKISQQIHDKVGHTIAGSLMQLEAAKLLVEKDKDKSTAVIGKVIETLRDGLEDIRIIVRKLKPKTEQIGINRIKLIISKFQLETLKIYFTYDEEVDKIRLPMWKVIEENIIEALTNVAKYSKATRVNISIEKFNKFIKVSIKDNGVGRDKINKGMGIIGMEERTYDLNGKFIIDGSDGFSIIMIFPI